MSGRNPAEFALHSAKNIFKEQTPNLPRFVCVVGDYMSSMSRMCSRKTHGHQYVEACITELSIVQP